MVCKAGLRWAFVTHGDRSAGGEDGAQADEETNQVRGYPRKPPQSSARTAAATARPSHDLSFPRMPELFLGPWQRTEQSLR